MQNRKHYCIVAIFVPSMRRGKFTPKLMPGGNKLSIGMISPKSFFQYDSLKMANTRNASFNKNSHNATAFEKALRDMRRELKVKKGDDLSEGGMIIPLPFRCDQHIVRWYLLSFENKDREIMDKHRPDVQMNDILSFILLSEEKMKSDEKEEDDIIVFRSPIRRGRSKVDSSPPFPMMINFSNSTKKRMRTAIPKHTTATAAKSSPQSGRKSFETAAMIVDPDVDAD